MKRALFLVILALIMGTHAWAAGPYGVPFPEGDGLITEDGVFVLEPGVTGDILTIEPGLVYLAGEKGDYAIIDRNGKNISELRVSMARYADGVILFRWNGAYGAMDLEGNVIVAPGWSQLVSNGVGGFLAIDDYPMDDVPDEVIYISPEGEVIRTGNETVGVLPDVSEDRMPYMTMDGRYGYLDGAGARITEPEWLYAGGFSHGTAVVSDENGMGVVDKNGMTLLECGYVSIEKNDSLIAALSSDGVLEVWSADMRRQHCAIDAKGMSMSVVGGYVALFGTDRAELYARDGSCLYTGSGKTTFSEGLNRQLIVSDGAWGEACTWIMDPDGSAASGMYQRILPLSGNRYAFQTMSGAIYHSQALDALQRSWNYDSIRYGMIDGDGHEILPAEYEDILAVEDDRFFLTGEAGSYLCDESGNIIQSWLLPGEDGTNS